MAVSPFDTSHYAGTWLKRVGRAVQLGPKYFFLDVPRYSKHRQRAGLGAWDGGVFISPLRELFPRGYIKEDLPDHYEEALQKCADVGVRLTIPRVRLKGLATCWWQVRSVLGDVIECGAFEGATSIVLAVLGRLNNISQVVHVCDTFFGSPEVSMFDLSRYAGEFRPERDALQQLHAWAERLHVSDRLQVHAGLFAHTFPALAATHPRFAFAHVDANLYQSTWEACEFVLPRMAPTSVVVFDDYNGVVDLGARLAIAQHLHARRLRVMPLAGTSAFMRT